MNNLNLFQQFGRSSEGNSAEYPNGSVIYTRVSTKNQADHNYSLETQLEGCEKLNRELGTELVERFGGIGESAKSGADRKEFQRMMTFLRKNKKRIGHLIVYNMDRFARDFVFGEQAIVELENLNIRLHSVMQQVDGSTSAGKLHRRVLMAFGQYENDNRTDKCVAGMVKRMENGKFCGLAPFGYENITRAGEKTIIPTDDAVFVRAAFEMRAYERLTHSEIVKRLEAMGCKRLYKQRLTELFRNPTYCGMIRHNMLNGRVILGKHEPIVSRELFLMANELQQQNPQGWKQDPENDAIPLKSFLKCDKCGTPFTGYLVKAKGLHYYKCNKKGCKVNTSAKKSNEDFREIISHFVLEDNLRALAKRELLATFAEAEKEKAERLEMLRANRNAVGKKLDRLEERFIDEEIDRTMFEKHSLRLKASIRQIEVEIEKAGELLSNHEETINFATEIASNLAKLWDSGNYSIRQGIQEMVFPEGMTYNKENDIYRTTRVSSLFTLFARKKPKIGQKKSGQTLQFAKLSASVQTTGQTSNLIWEDLKHSADLTNEVSKGKIKGG
jgi:DNA invertase Pin-like site-specific DNA recombinase